MAEIASNPVEALELVRAFVDNLPAEGDAISGYIRGGVRYELTGAALRVLLDEDQEMRELLGSIWLYVKWHFVTKQLTTPQKELFADAVDAISRARQIEDGEEPRSVADRWWRD
jgi:DNA-binding transcriptional regulator PaaX